MKCYHSDLMFFIEDDGVSGKCRECGEPFDATQNQILAGIHNRLYEIQEESILKKMEDILLKIENNMDATTKTIFDRFAEIEQLIERR